MRLKYHIVRCGELSIRCLKSNKCRLSRLFSVLEGTGTFVHMRTGDRTVAQFSETHWARRSIGVGQIT